MFWLGSSRYQGYGKGKYSLAFPAGFGFIGLVFLVIGALIALRFPSIVTDWTKGEVCIVKAAEVNYKNWVGDRDREVSLTVSVNDWTNVESAIKSGKEPQFSWSGPYAFKENSIKKDVQFHSSDQRVTFTKDLDYTASSSSMNQTVTVPNLWLLRRHSNLGDPTDWIYRSLPQLLISIADWNANHSDILTYWNQSIFDCDSCIDYPFSFSSEKKNQTSIGGSGVAKRFWNQFGQSILVDLVAQGHNPKEATSTTNCPLDGPVEQHSKGSGDSACPECFISQDHLDLLLINHRVLQEQKSSTWSKLKLCYGQRFSFTLTDDQFYTIISSIDQYYFHSLRRELMIRIVSKNGIHLVDHASKAISTKDDSMGFKIGILNSVFGDHKYDWSTCDVGCVIKTDKIFQWKSLDSRSVEWSPYSEYFLPPPSSIEPCLQPRLPIRIPMLLEGLWRPTILAYKQSNLLHGERVYVYELTSGMLPYDGIFPSDDLHLNVTSALRFHSFVSPIPSNHSIMDEVMASIYVEPVTGAIWHSQVTFEISIVIDDELLQAANLTRLMGQRIPLVRITRLSQVTKDASKFLREQLKPMLAVICGGVIISTFLAMIFVGLALALIVKLHWRPFWERAQVQPEPQDLRLLNTVKLRKLMGT